MFTSVLLLFVASAQAFTLQASPLARSSAVASSSAAPAMFFGKKPAAQEPSIQNARDADFARRQDRLAQRQAGANAAPKGQVEVTFPQKGGKVVKAMQGDAIGKVCQKAGALGSLSPSSVVSLSRPNAQRTQVCGSSSTARTAGAGRARCGSTVARLRRCARAPRFPAVLPRGSPSRWTACRCHQVA